MKLNHILYIDDDSDILLIAQIALERIGGFNVTTCSNSNDALRLARQCKPDLIMLDVMMPDIDGPGIFQRLKDEPLFRDTPVIFMTAKAQASEREYFLSLGAVGVILKPFSPATLSEQIMAYWKSSKAGQSMSIPGDLNERFIIHLKKKHEALIAFLERYELGKLSDAERKEMLYLVHNLGGSGLTYGYPEITQTAQALEKAMEAHATCEVVAHTRHLLAVINRIADPVKRHTA